MPGSLRRPQRLGTTEGSGVPTGRWSREDGKGGDAAGRATPCNLDQYPGSSKIDHQRKLRYPRDSFPRGFCDEEAWFVSRHFRTSTGGYYYMYAIVEAGGRQWRVEPGMQLDINHLDGAVGSQHVLDRVLLASDGQSV